LVHTEDISTIEAQYSIIPVTFPEEMILRIPPENLPDEWALPEPTAVAQMIGDRWIAGRMSVVLEVPSAVTHEETNYLINPNHLDFQSIEMGTPVPFPFGHWTFGVEQMSNVMVRPHCSLSQNFLAVMSE
jgi:RES domain-containing protein